MYYKRRLAAKRFGQFASSDPKCGEQFLFSSFQILMEIEKMVIDPVLTGK
jgi:hypothetical protein